MKKKLSKFILKLFGWKIEMLPDIKEVKKGIILVAPHTSAWDFVWGKLIYISIGFNMTFLIAKKFFVFPLGKILKRLGGHPIDRKSPTALISLKNDVENSEKFWITICPEGTRKATEKWKRGFYLLAKETNLPVFLGSLDYKNKNACLGKRFLITDNFQEDMLQMEGFYNASMAKYPEKFAKHTQEICKTTTK